MLENFLKEVKDKNDFSISIHSLEEMKNARRLAFLNQDTPRGVKTSHENREFWNQP
jgi:hypothetical protein